MAWRDRRYADDPDDEIVDDPEAPDESDQDWSDEPDLDVCPHCRKLISEEAERCPHCGQYISLEAASLSKPAWLVIGVIVAILIVLIVWNKLR